MFGDSEALLELAERMLEVFDLDELFDDNDLTEAEVLSALIRAGLIDCGYFTINTEEDE